MSNQTDTATQDEKAVEDTHPQVVFSLLGRKRAAVAKQINEADGNTTIHVEDQVVLLRGCDSLDGDGVIEEFVGGKVLDDELLDKLDTKIGVGARLDTVTDTRNCKKCQ